MKKLGISHLYASPIFTATSGSVHGYDVTNCNEIDPAIGGREGFDRLCARLEAAVLGLIVILDHSFRGFGQPNGSPGRRTQSQKFGSRRRPRFRS